MVALLHPALHLGGLAAEVDLPSLIFQVDRARDLNFLVVQTSPMLIRTEIMYRRPKAENLDITVIMGIHSQDILQVDRRDGNLILNICKLSFVVAKHVCF